MATLTFGTTLARPVSGLRGFFARIAAARAERRQRALIRRELEMCDPRDLRDLGISAYDFESIARGTFRK